MMNKRVKWTLIGLGIFVLVLIVVAISTLVIVFIATGINIFSKELTPETKIPTEVEETASGEESEEISEIEEDNNRDLVIEDLAYIKILCLPYMDDSDPETDGIYIDLSFYNNKGKNISFDNIPVDVNIKFFTTKFNWDTGEDEIVKPPVYEGVVKIDHSMRFSEMFGNYIRVPFEDIGPIPEGESVMGVVIVKVITPLQGEFEAKEEFITLEPY